jgi:hypothetical protein
LLVTSDTKAVVTGAIQQASRLTGVPFDYLMKTAMRESSLNPTLKASTSTATGLFQMLEQTWLGLLEEEGGKYGYGHYAESIERTGPGRYRVNDPALRQEIMALRNDPLANAVIGGGAFTRQNQSALTRALGRAPSDKELYVAHFFGPGQAAQFLKALNEDPAAPVAALFPRAAEANRSVFYTRGGEPRSAQGVFDVLTKRHGDTSPVPGPAAAESVVAQARGPQPRAAWSRSASTDQGPVLSFAADQAPAFHGLFQTRPHVRFLPSCAICGGRAGCRRLRTLRLVTRSILLRSGGAHEHDWHGERFLKRLLWKWSRGFA